jgi:hypothetical protein
MIIKLPIVTKKEFNEETQKLIVDKGTLEVEIDTSFKAHLKWEEQNFGAALGGIDLRTYTERVQKMLASNKPSKVELLSLLKLLYCYINSNKLPTFRDFLGLFELEVADEILEKIRIVLEEVSKSASKN